MMNLNLFAMATPSPLFEGLWRHPEDRSATGYRSLDYWNSISTAGTGALSGQSAVWTGSEMLVWGARDGSSASNLGGRYNPSSNSWTAPSASRAKSVGEHRLPCGFRQSTPGGPLRQPVSQLARTAS